MLVTQPLDLVSYVAHALVEASHRYGTLFPLGWREHIGDRAERLRMLTDYNFLLIANFIERPDTPFDVRKLINHSLQFRANNGGSRDNADQHTAKR